MNVVCDKPSFTINLNGDVVALTPPLVMGILNVTPDSFYAGSRCNTEAAVISRAREIVEQGGAIIDIGLLFSTSGRGCPGRRRDEPFITSSFADSVGISGCLYFYRYLSCRGSPSLCRGIRSDDD